MALLSNLKNLIPWLRKPIGLIVVGTDISAFKFCTHLLQNKSPFSVKFAINEEPWQHKTRFAGAQCRYPSELTALIMKHDIRAVICFSKKDREIVESLKPTQLHKAECAFICADNLRNPKDLEREIRLSIDQA